MELINGEVKMKNPKISIITINYNEPSIERTCESVINQTFKDYEWIIIDGGSTEPRTLTVLEKYRKYATYFVSEPDNGIYNAMNKGIARAKGDWLIFMNAGDCFYDLKVLENMAPYIDKNVDCTVVYGETLIDTGQGERLFTKCNLNNLYFMTGSIPHPSSFIRRDVFLKYGNYREDLKIVSDWLKFAEMYWAGEKFEFVKVLVAKFAEGGVSSQNLDNVFIEHAKIWLELHPWAFDEKLLKRRKVFFGFLRKVVFFGELRSYFEYKKHIYKTLLKYTKMYSSKFIKDKILLIDHSYHEKTRSSEFFVNLLREHFDCDVAFDDSWETGGKQIDNNKYDFTKYKHIIFWQLIPRWKHLKKIKHKSMFWVPMENICGGRKKGIRKIRKICSKVKVISFSDINHILCEKVGGVSLRVKFFIKPTDFIPGDKNGLFFWQRINSINIRNVIQVLPSDKKLSIHLHKAVDPFNTFIFPKKSEESKYNITYSDWFENKEEMIALIKQRAIYIAPRELEGIGMSFLEALSMGKIIIAQNNPTMNEYIENGVNGYLVDFNNPKPIDLSDMEWIQKNAYETAKVGYARWKNDEMKIIDFIKHGGKITNK
ncbi:MAG: glycosyltransferase [Rickettsiales bacterium]|jgi:glycosyltransferase involved in cell wall biosynthesis|nr:glycosyltransferase [Rickettsiales bacterium]